jgi:hypothetical protein
MAQLDINDYLELLRAPLGRAVDRTRRAVERELFVASQRGFYGDAIQRGMDVLRREFDMAILFVLARTKRARQRASLDHSELWLATKHELENFTRQMKSTADHEGLGTLRLSQMSFVLSELAKLDEALSLALRRYEEEFLDFDETPSRGDEAKAAAANLNPPLAARSVTQAEADLADQAESAPPDASTLEVASTRILAVRAEISDTVLTSIDTAGPPEPLSYDLKNAFLEAAVRCSEWKFGGTEPVISLDGQLYKISDVCHFVMACKNEPLPDNLADELARLPDQRRAELMEVLGNDWTYHSGAQSVFGHVDDRAQRFGNPK